MVVDKSDNPSFVLRAVHDTIYEERPIPKLEPYDVLINVKKTGICGSDVHYLNHGGIGEFKLRDPMCLGHESAGIVVEVGPEVTSVKVGDRVAMEPQYVCKRCDLCKAGKYNLCAKCVFAATPPNTSGTLTRYFKLGEDFVFKLPESMSLEDGALIEPMAVAVHSVQGLGAMKSGQNVLVLGAGPVGLLIMGVAKALGAARIIAVDINADRLKFAKAYAATDIYQPPASTDPNESRVAYSERVAGEMAKELDIDPKSLTEGIDLVLEASGAEVCVQIGLFLVKYGGTFVQVGMGSPNVVLPLHLLLRKELTVKGSFRYGPGDYKTAIGLAARGLIDLKPLVTHRFKFTDAVRAFEVTRQGKSEDGTPSIKCIIEGPE